MTKTPDQIATLRRVAKLTDGVFTAVVPCIRQGVTQPALEDEIRRQGMARGAEGVSFDPAAIFTKTGSPPSTEAFTYPRERGLEAGCSVAFDFGFVMDGLCSDFGRSLYLGPAPEHIAGAYRALQQAVLDAVAEIRPGATRFCDLYPVVERSLDERGYGDFLRARLKEKVLGHCIGATVHEEPWLRPDCDRPILPGTVFAIEPKLWHTGQYYLRVEDMVLVGPEGAELLTCADRELFEL
jgi:Xaa-Pro aminopeptidase